MPFSIQTDPDTGIVTIAATGAVVKAPDVLEAIRTAYKQARPNAPLLALWDIRLAAGMPSPQEMRTIAEFVRQNRPNVPGRVAIVTPASGGHSDFVFGMSRMAEGLTAVAIPEISVFRDFEEAAGWLSAFTAGPI